MNLSNLKVINRRAIDLANNNVVVDDSLWLMEGRPWQYVTGKPDMTMAVGKSQG